MSDAHRKPTVREVVARQLAGLPLSPEEQTARVTGRKVCLDCGVKPVAEKGSQAYAEGLCGDCASWKRRHGDHRTDPIEGIE